uniref:RRM domain-containing protein n=1 Tax=Astatotilapia calliptera TaxID=8154 RepID=A0AAX7USM3_ASTCA
VPHHFLTTLLTDGEHQDSLCPVRYGEIVNINLVRDKKTGKSKGFCFICYEDQRSTVLAVDNFNSIKIKGRTIRVDHVKDYRPPKDGEDIDDVTKHLREEGCAPKVSESSPSSEDDEQYAVPVKKPKKDKKEKKKKKKEKKKDRKSRASSSSPPPVSVRVKEEKEDAGYDKYNQRGPPPKPGGQPNGQTVRHNERLRREEEEERRRRDADRQREEEKKRGHERENDRSRDNDRRRETERERRRDADRDRDDRRRERDRDDDRRR